MGARFIFWILFLNLLVIMCCCHGSDGSTMTMGGTEENTSFLNHHQHNHDHDHHVHHHQHQHDHMDPQVMVFFTLKDLKIGKRMPIHFPKRDTSKSPKLWPREEADSVPFSLSHLPHLLKLFPFSANSPQATAIEDTLRECESKPIKGEVKFCATSLESMLDFTQKMLGPGSEIQVFSTLHKTKSSVNFQNYTILEILMELAAPKMVACHTMPFPYAVFYCHSQKSENRVYKVSLVGDNEDRVEAMVVCHTETSQWIPTHISFRVLKVLPGTSSVCHFFPADHFIFVPKMQVQGFSSV